MVKIWPSFGVTGSVSHTSVDAYLLLNIVTYSRRIKIRFRVSGSVLRNFPLRLTDRRAHVLDYLTEEYGLTSNFANIGIASVYFTENSSDQSDPRHIIAMLIKQLCWRTDKLPQDLIEFYQKYDSKGGPPLLDLYIKYFWVISKSFDQVFLVVDGLDECAKPVLPSIHKFLQAYFETVPRAKLFVTSRTDSNIQVNLSQ